MTTPDPLPGLDGLLIATQIAAFLPPEHQDAASTLLPTEAPMTTTLNALDTWLRIPEGEDEAEAEANTYLHGTGYRVKWCLTAVGLITSVDFDTLPDAHAWLESEGFTDFTADATTVLAEDLLVCTECALLIANGGFDVADEWETTPEEVAERQVDQWGEHAIGLTLTSGDKVGFATRPCDGCGSVWHGERHPAVVFARTDTEEGA